MEAFLGLDKALLADDQARVGWVEQRDTHRLQLLGIAALHPTYIN